MGTTGSRVGEKQTNKRFVTPVNVEVSIYQCPDVVTGIMECLVTHTTRKMIIDCARWTGPPVKLTRPAM